MPPGHDSFFSPGPVVIPALSYGPSFFNAAFSVAPSRPVVDSRIQRRIYQSSSIRKQHLKVMIKIDNLHTASM